MTRSLELPADPMGRFVELYRVLNEDRRWFQSVMPLRFAAMSALSCPGSVESVASEIRAAADEIKDEVGGFDSLRGDLRFIVAAMLVVQGDSAPAFMSEVERVRGWMRSASMRRGGIYETMAILVMRTQAALAPIEASTLDRFRALYEEMKRHHWWLTGPDDFPACAILTGRDEPVREIGEGIERIYQALHEERFAKGDPLQLAANLLYLANRDADEIASRYRALADGFRAAGVRIWQSDYDELAILSFLGQAPALIVDRVVARRAEVAELKPRVDGSLSFNLAAGIAFLELVQDGSATASIRDAKALMDMQAIIQAQQAAVVAATSAATASAASS